MKGGNEMKAILVEDVEEILQNNDDWNIIYEKFKDLKSFDYDWMELTDEELKDRMKHNSNMHKENMLKAMNPPTNQGEKNENN